MNSLNQRARRAVESVEASTGGYQEPAPFPVMVRRHRIAQFAQGALAFAAVVVFIALGAYLRPAPEPTIADETPEPIVEETPDVEPETPEVDALPDPETPIEPIDPFDPGPAEDTPVVQEPVAEPPVEQEPPPTTEPADTTPPDIAITSPRDGQRVETDTIRFEGTTEPGATVVAGRWAADVDARGNWAIKLVLVEGANRASFTATDAAGNSASASIVVHYEPPPPPPKDDGGDEKPPADWEFAAYQVFGSCAETPPFDVFHGTAEPGTVVSIVSEYGSGSVEVNAKGEWEVKVFFPEAKIGKVFGVKVKDVHGNKKVFEFVHTKK
jgi:hypothetical protein